MAFFLQIEKLFLNEVEKGVKKKTVEMFKILASILSTKQNHFEVIKRDLQMEGPILFLTHL